MSAIEKIEHQANYATAAFLMPRKAVEHEFLDRVGISLFPQQPLEWSLDIEVVIREMAELFSVNYSPMKYRLQDVGLIARQKQVMSYLFQD